MSREIKNIIDDALFNFYLEADKDTIIDSLQENIQNLVEYEQKEKEIIVFS
jgi:hypothetical protein